MATNNSINDTEVPPYLAKAGGTMAGAINMGSHQINAVTDPTLAQDAATKNYVDQTALNGTSVYAATVNTSMNATQSGAGVGATLTDASGTFAALSLDGVAIPLNANVLVKNTGTGVAAQNEGIYTLTRQGDTISIPWQLTRATSYDTATEINNTGLIVVQNGSTLAGTAWYNSATIVTVDTTSFSYAQFGSSLTKKAITEVIIRTFAAGSNTYTPTAGMQYCTVEIVGGGGSGGGVSGGTAGQASAAGGGGGGGYCRKTYTAALIGANAAVVVGSGGLAATSGAHDGNAGGNSTFTPAGAGAILTGTGGGAGSNMAENAAAAGVAGGTSGTGTNGDINISGARGGAGAIQAAGALALSGTGGGTALSPSAHLAPQTTTGGGATALPVGYGCGSNGAVNIANANSASNAGADGICYITEYVSV